MGIFDWLRGDPEAPREPAGISRRDFFARVAGRLPDTPADESPTPPGDGDHAENASAHPDDGETAGGLRVLHTFQVVNFPYYDGPVLVPILRAGDEYRIGVDPPYSRNPTGLRIERGRECLGTVPEDVFADVLPRIRAGETLVCRALTVDPAAELAKVLTVQILRVLPENEEANPESSEAPLEEGASEVETEEGDGEPSSAPR